LPSSRMFGHLTRLSAREATVDSVASSSGPNPPESQPSQTTSYSFDRWWLLVLAIVALLVFLMVFKSDPYWNIMLFVRDGLGITVFLTVVSFVFILLVGMIGGLGRISKNPVIYFFATLYVEVFRGIPLLVQLIWWYFAAPVVIQSIGKWINFAPMANYQSNALLLAVLGLVMCYGAYVSEIYRAGIQSIPKGQMEAARSQGMTYIQAMRHVILPQAIRVILPPIGNEFIMLIKDSSLVSVVAVADLVRRGREFMSTHFDPIEVWTMVALLYLVLTLFFTRLMAWLEKRRRYER
jgi:polar amino acid transport system permease protein